MKTATLKAGKLIDIDEPSKPSKVSVRKAKQREFDKFSTGYVLWQLVLRHKMGLLIAGNVFWLVNWAFPEWRGFLGAMIGG